MYKNTYTDPEKENIYKLITAYFENPTMTKIKDVHLYSMYMTKMYAVLGIAYRYLIVFTTVDKNPKNTQIPLQNLYWVSLQTRTLQDEHNLPPHYYTPKRLHMLDQKITLKEKDPKKYIYTVDKLPLTITLLPKTIEYNNTGSVVTALETYETILNFL